MAYIADVEVEDLVVVHRQARDHDVYVPHAAETSHAHGPDSH